MIKTLGIDLGTSSIGLTIRNISKGKNIVEQLEYFSSVIFKTGVGNGKTGEFSYAAERTKHRSSRRLYQSRKYRIWETLKVLIEFGFCPLSNEDLLKWSRYDRSLGFKREYPTNAVAFEQWVRLDFNGDGISDYSSPYQLRAELATRQFDFNDENNRFKFGRVLYHIAQRRGFKSSKGETIKEQEKEAESKKIIEKNDVDYAVELKKSEEKKSKDLVSYMQNNDLQTIGIAFAKIEKEGVRIRGSIYQAVRSQYEAEIKYIFDFQNGLTTENGFYKKINNAIFYKRPLKSQKGLVGKCILETNKSRCPISHPEFEKFRAWSFINNIKYRMSNYDNWLELDINIKQKLFEDKFLRTSSSFDFKEIRIWLEKQFNIPLYYKNTDDKTINYKDTTTVSGCPITGRIKNLFGDNWETISFSSKKTRDNINTGEVRQISYNAYDLWHICFSFDDAEKVEEFAINELNLSNEQSSAFVRVWGAISQGYGQLSLKAIKNINYFLAKGLIYSDAVLLAKLPEIFGKEFWSQNEEKIMNDLGEINNKYKQDKRILNIVNSLISNYKSLDLDEQFANRNFDYKLDKSDYTEVENYTIESYGMNSWKNKMPNEQSMILKSVTEKYQGFFASKNRNYYKVPKMVDALKSYLSENYQLFHCLNYLKNSISKQPCNCDACKNLKKLYHPSQIEFYQPSREQTFEHNNVILSKKLLKSPVIGAFKNPMAMRALHILRQQINSLLIKGLIDEDTRIIVETAKDLNDSNMRWAIDAYQRERERENKEFVSVIKDTLKITREISDEEIDKARLLIEQQDIPLVEGRYKKEIDKYRLWLEQGCMCMYTGKILNISTLFSERGGVDFEHTIPRSISFDNSLANLTVCDAYYNRHVKKNQIPSQLPNYENDASVNGNIYTAIKPRLEHWIIKVEHLKDNVDYWRQKSKKAQDKDQKDFAIRQRHLWQMEFDYWKNKLARFTMEEVTSGFINSQLVDTRIITKYAFHYLKSVFNNVDVQKGSVTADFRKLIGVQSVDEKKSRDKHSHHAIDAAILTLIPSSAKRDRMLKYFYEIQEMQRLNEDVSRLIGLLNNEKLSCNIGSVSKLGQYIEENILINHISKDQTLTPAKRKVRRRGKLVFVENKDGELVQKWNKGDCIRGQLHKDSFFGAIKFPKTDNDGELIIDKGRFSYSKDKEGSDVFLIVKRIPIIELKSEKDYEIIVDKKVRESVKSTIEKRKQEGKSFNVAITEPIWIMDKNGREKKFDKNGKQLAPIRHIRCKVKAGKGFFTKDKALVIKEQTYISEKNLINVDNRDYKKNYYAQNDGNYLCLLYEGLNKGKIERKYKLINYFEIAKLKIRNISSIWNEPYYQKIDDSKILNLIAVVKVGTRVLMWKESPDELFELSNEDLIKRMFIVIKFNSVGIEYVYLQNHIESREEKLLGQAHTSFDPLIYQARIMLTANNFNCLIEGKDFEIGNIGSIHLNN